MFGVTVIPNLVELFNKEKSKETSPYSNYQIDKTINVLNSIHSYYENKIHSASIAKDIETVTRWACDSWPWDNYLTTSTMSIIEEYEKGLKINKKIIE